jgi:hypothetical protein
MEDITEALWRGYPDTETVERFYSALAKAISTWQNVEMGLFVVFEKTVFSYVDDQRNDYRALAAAFHGLQHFNSQLTMTDMAVRTRLHHAKYIPELGEKWQNIYSRAGKKYPKRNSLVHFGVVTRAQEKKQNNKISIEPLFTDERYRINIREKVRYTINDIIGMTSGFRKLASDLVMFSESLVELSARQRAFLSL